MSPEIDLIFVSELSLHPLLCAQSQLVWTAQKSPLLEQSRKTGQKDKDF